MRRRIALLLCGGPRDYGGRYASGGSFGVPAHTIVVQRPVYVQRSRAHPIHRREWVREHRHHDHRERGRRDWRDWRLRR